MKTRRLLTQIVPILVAIQISGCSGGTNTSGLQVTVVPPVVFETPYAAPTPVQPDVQQPSAPEVRAGEVDDNERWDDYLRYRREYRGPLVHEVDVSERYIITALDANDLPILDASVTILDGQNKLWEARTYASGQTLFFPRAFTPSQSQTYIVSVAKDGFAYTFDLHRNQQESWVARIEQYVRAEQKVNLDVLFLLDATGSMSDEIKVLQTSTLSIANQVDNMQPRSNLRFGLVSYRDRGDSYVVRKSDFTANVNTFSKMLKDVDANGGGDYPESLNEALHVAIHEMDWREKDTVRLIFLIADAPPHLDYAQDYDYAQEMAVAAANGIKIFPIAASGTDDQAEFVFRQLAQFTQGRYLFLTYEGPTGGGAPGDVSEMHVDGYSVQDLDDLVVRLIREELANQSNNQ